MIHSQRFIATGDLIQAPQLQNVNGKSVCRARLGIVETRTVNGQKQNTQVSHSIEAWNKTAQHLASIPVGNTIMIEGKVQNYKYKDQQGNEKWATKITCFSVGNCGPSQYAQQQQGQQNYNQQSSYNNAGNQNSGGYPPQNHNSGGYGGAPQGPSHNSGGGFPPTFDENEQIPF